MVFHLRDARAAGVPLLLELALSNFESKFFAAEAFELLRKLFTLLRERGGFIPNRGFLLQELGFAPVEFRALFLQARRKGFGSGEAFMESSEFGAGSREVVLLGMHRPTKLRELLGEPRALGFRFRAADGCC